MTRALVFIAVVASACGGGGAHSYYEDGFSVAMGPKTTFDDGEPTQLHPAVLEVMLAAPEGPFRGYYAIEAGGSARAGENAARERARKIAPAVSRLLAMKGRATVMLFCCKYPTVSGDRLTKTGIKSALIASPDAQVVRLVFDAAAGNLDSAGLNAWRDLTWDVQQVPGAFDPAAPLTYEAVLEHVVALHEVETP